MVALLMVQPLVHHQPLLAHFCTILWSGNTSTADNGGTIDNTTIGSTTAGTTITASSGFAGDITGNPGNVTKRDGNVTSARRNNT